MYFGLSEEQSFFQDNVKKYLEEHATIDNIKHITSGDKKNLSAGFFLSLWVKLVGGGSAFAVRVAKVI